MTNYNIGNEYPLPELKMCKKIWADGEEGFESWYCEKWNGQIIELDEMYDDNFEFIEEREPMLRSEHRGWVGILESEEPYIFGEEDFEEEFEEEET